MAGGECFEQGAATCGQGNCPPNQTCVPNTKNGNDECRCEPDPIPCEQTFAPECGGECPEGLICVAPPNGKGITCRCEDPLYVVLDSFSATVDTDGVRLNWSTSAEIDNVGFRILRMHKSRSATTGIKSLLPRLQMVSAQLILAQGNATAGAQYKFLDTEVPRSGPVAYYLEDVDVFGAVRLHGPVVVVLGDSERKPRD